MIIEGIINLLLLPFTLLLDLLPSMEMIVIPDNVFTTFKTILTMCSVVLPVRLCISLFAFKITIVGINVVWALILRVKSFIPTMGN